jgi:hypothetical protein
VAKGNAPRDPRRERTTVLGFLLGYGGFAAGTAIIPFAPTLGGIIFWAGVFGVFWAGWISAKK